MEHTRKNALSTAAEIKDRCLKRKTRIRVVTSTSNPSVYILIFEDGTQANIDDAVLEQLHMNEPELWVQGHHPDLV